uniref:DUF2471 family protein n=1 Tax=Burkholderia arboris TaxID=488730 RepID=UPI003BEF2674
MIHFPKDLRGYFIRKETLAFAIKEGNMNRAIDITGAIHIESLLELPFCLQEGAGSVWRELSLSDKVRLMWTNVDDNDPDAPDIPGWHMLMIDLAELANELIRDYREQHPGEALTWRALLVLERRAITRLKGARRYSADLLHLIRYDPALFSYPNTDMPVDLRQHGFLPVVMGEIWAAWRRLH